MTQYPHLLPQICPSSSSPLFFSHRAAFLEEKKKKIPAWVPSELSCEGHEVLKKEPELWKQMSVPGSSTHTHGPLAICQAARGHLGWSGGQESSPGPLHRVSNCACMRACVRACICVCMCACVPATYKALNARSKVLGLEKDGSKRDQDL